MKKGVSCSLTKEKREYDKPKCELFSYEIMCWKCVNKVFSRIKFLASECDVGHSHLQNCQEYIYFG